MARLQAHDWPGNIRELRNVLDRARLFADDGIVRAEYLPEQMGKGQSASLSVAPVVVPASPRGSVGDAELKRLTQTSNCTRRELAIQLGLSERTLYRRLKALDLT